MPRQNTPLRLRTSAKNIFRNMVAVLLSNPILALILLASLSSSHASKCIFYKTKVDCNHYTDTGSCLWDTNSSVCLEGGKKLPPGTFGVALMPLIPDSMPLVLRPGPSSSSGNVSLVNGSEVSLEVVPAPISTPGSLPRSSTGPLELKTLEEKDPTKTKKNTSERRLRKLLATPATEEASFCSLPPVQGRCRAYFPVWYWDQEAQNCAQFIWGGCGGNANRFPTLEECENAVDLYCKS